VSDAVYVTCWATVRNCVVLVLQALLCSNLLTQQ
jgi:hypothetical protein